jgi:hypothetical protein
MNISSMLCLIIIVGASAAIADQPQKEKKVDELLLRLEQANSIRIRGVLMHWDPVDESKKIVDATSTSPEVIIEFATWMKSVSWRPIDFYEPFASATTVEIEFKVNSKSEMIVIFGGCLRVGSRVYEEYDTELPSGLFLRKWLSENRNRFVFVKDK